MSKRRNGNMGRQSVFRDKRGGMRLQAFLTKRGGELFQLHRGRLAKVTQREPTHLSAADVVEFLVRGEAGTRDYLAGIAK